MSKTSPAKTYKKSEASREQVLSAAVATLAQRGFANTSVKDIADSAGLSKGAVHYHFENKDDLIQCVLERCCEQIAARAKSAWEAPGTPADRVRRALEEMWQVRKERTPELRVMFDLLAQAVHDESLRPPMAKMLRRSREQIFESGLVRLMELGLKPKVAPEVIPRLLLGALDGLALHAIFDPPTPEEEAEVLRAVEIISFALFEL